MWTRIVDAILHHSLMLNYNCYDTSEWNSFDSSLKGVSSSNGASVEGCSSKRKETMLSLSLIKHVRQSGFGDRFKFCVNS